MIRAWSIVMTLVMEHCDDSTWSLVRDSLPALGINSVPEVGTV